MSTLPRPAEPRNVDTDDPAVLMSILNRHATGQPVGPAELAAARARFGLNPDGTRRLTRYELARRAREESERRRAEREAMAEMEAECRRAERSHADALYWAAWCVGEEDGRFGRLYASDGPEGLTEAERGVWRSGYLASRNATFVRLSDEVNEACEGED